MEGENKNDQRALLRAPLSPTANGTPDAAEHNNPRNTGTPTPRDHIVPLLIGTPVVFHEDPLKIRDAHLYCGEKEISDDTVELQEIYSPRIVMAAKVGMVDYDPDRHRDALKYVVISDGQAEAFTSQYHEEYGPQQSCKVMSASSFFESLCRASVEHYFHKNNKPLQPLPLNAFVHVNYSNPQKDDLYDSVVNIGMRPLYDLEDNEDIFKYIVCPETKFHLYRHHVGELMSRPEFKAHVSYTEWIQPERFATPNTSPGTTHSIQRKGGGMTVSTKGTTVCFTGCGGEKEGLRRIAIEHGLKPVASVTKSLGLLVVGTKNPGGKKLLSADELHVKKVSLDSFKGWIGFGTDIDQIPEMKPIPDCMNVGDRLHLPAGIFAAVDVETADFQHDSMCAIGFVVCENGTVVEEGNYLFRPPRRKVKNTGIHGLDWKTLAEHQPLDITWSEILPILERADYLVAHNAVFDRSVLGTSCGAYGIKPPSPPFLCTMRGAKEVLKYEGRHSLDILCRRLSIPLRHHQALSDAKAALKLLEYIHEKTADFRNFSLEPIAIKHHARPVLVLNGSLSKAVEEFHTISKALTCDDVLTEGEFRYLCSWLTKHDHLTETKELGPVFSKVADILEDGIVTREELDSLLDFLKTQS